MCVRASRHLNCHNSRFCWRIYFVYIHLRLFCVRLVRCVLDATGMLPSMDDVYVHCGPSPSTIWGMSIMSQSFCQLPTSHSVKRRSFFTQCLPENWVLWLLIVWDYIHVKKKRSNRTILMNVNIWKVYLSFLKRWCFIRSSIHKTVSRKNRINAKEARKNAKVCTISLPLHTSHSDTYLEQLLRSVESLALCSTRTDRRFFSSFLRCKLLSNYDT